MVTRRTLKRQINRSHTLRHMAIFAVCGVVLIVLIAIAKDAGWLAGTAVLCAVSFAAGKRRNTAPRTAEVVTASPRVIGDSRSRRNGWTPPLQSQLLSRECASAENMQSPEHGFCHDPGCKCSCNHWSQNKPLVRIPIPDVPEF